MKKLLLLIVCVLAFSKANSQFIKEQSIEVSVGYGLSFPYQDVDVFGDGFFAQGEYVFTAYSWLDLRPYAGFIFTGESSAQSLPQEFKATASAFLFGGKVRLTAPIPYFAPYLELGLGGSVGEFETSIPLLYRKQSGLLFHIPFSIGAEIGKDKRINIEFTYYYHDAVQQVVGAFAVGFRIPMASNKSD